MSKAHGGSKRQVRSRTRLLRDREEWARRAPGHPGNRQSVPVHVENCPGIMRHGREVL